MQGSHGLLRYFDGIPLNTRSCKDRRCRNATVFTRIMLPISFPIITFVAVSSFIGPWMDYILPAWYCAHQVKDIAIGLLKWLQEGRIPSLQCLQQGDTGCATRHNTVYEPSEVPDTGLIGRCIKNIRHVSGTGRRIGISGWKDRSLNCRRISLVV